MFVNEIYFLTLLNYRNVTITAIDCNEAIGQPSTVVIKFNRACNIWSSMDSTIRVPLDLSIEELSICTSVSAFHIRITGNISSLLPLRDLQVIKSILSCTHNYNNHY